MYLVAKVLDEDGKIIGGRPEGYLLTMDREYDMEKDAEFGTGVPGFTISSANFNSKGMQNTFTGSYGVVARVDGRLNHQVDVTFTKNNDNTVTYTINPYGGTIDPVHCTSPNDKCIYQSGTSFKVDGTVITLSGGIGALQPTDIIKIMQSTGAEANWKVEVSLHYANADDASKYDAEPIDIDGSQTYSLAVKVIGQMSPTSGNCVANNEIQPIGSSCKCNGETCPATSGQNTYKYCYGKCRQYPRCTIDEKSPVTSACVCDSSQLPDKADCDPQTAAVGQHKYCVNTNNVPSCITK
jgi:hypothetical protein